MITKEYALECAEHGMKVWAYACGDNRPRAIALGPIRVFTSSQKEEYVSYDNDPYNSVRLSQVFSSYDEAYHKACILCLDVILKNMEQLIEGISNQDVQAEIAESLLQFAKKMGDKIHRGITLEK
jgi:hypothetical protein